MPYVLLVAFSLLLVGCPDLDQLHVADPIPECEIGEFKRCECPMNGYYVCQEDRTWPKMCLKSGPGSVALGLPEIVELCNGVDDDCDGLVDEDINDPTIGTECTPSETVALEKCGPYTLKCGPSGPECHGSKERKKEICDGEDNDCDGFKDNIKPEFCYTYAARPESQNFRPCKPGVLTCDLTKPEKIFCDGEITPQIPDCSTLQDLDCNGVPDVMQLMGEPAQTDVVVFIDTSGSMAGIHSTLMNVLRSFARAQQTNSMVRFALVGMPGVIDRECGLLVNLTDTVSFFNAIRNITSFSYGAQEPTYDCPYLAADPAIQTMSSTNNPLGALAYRSGAKKIFISFSDDEAGGQSYRGVRENDVAQRLAQQNVTYFAFTSPSIQHLFDDIVTATHGSWYSLGGDQDIMVENLNGVLTLTTCGM